MLASDSSGTLWEICDRCVFGVMMRFIYAGDRAEPIGSYRKSAKPILAMSKLGSKVKSTGNVRSTR
jgi:hypothetical protein